MDFRCGQLGAMSNYLVMRNSGQWIFLRRGLVTCNNSMIPLALILRNSMSHYNYGILQESHQQSWRGDAKKFTEVIEAF